MGHWEILHSGGVPNYATRTYYVWLYANESKDESVARNDAADGVDDFCGQLVGDVIDYYEIMYNTQDHPNCDDSHRKDCYIDFKDWYTGKYDHLKGPHLCVDNDFAGGHADGGDGSNITAFTTARAASVGAKFTGSELRTTAVHEAMHPSVNNNLQSVKDMIDGNEHHLGKVDTANISSPFANNDRDMSKLGQCNSDRPQYGETTELFSCEYDAVSYTADDAY